MGYSVSSWFIDQTRTLGAEPKRIFKIGTSDYSDRVSKWPTFNRTAKDIKAVNPRVSLANADGALNLFFENTYSMPNTCTLEIGFTHPTSGDELITVYTGFLTDVSYTKKECITSLKDRLWEFTQKKVGDSDNPVEFSSVIPSDIAWTLCTCYGGLSVDSDTNPNINYASFLEWAAIFSRDNIVCDAYYDGLKIKEGLTNLARMTDSAIWIEGDGKINFKRFTEASSLDVLITRDEFTELGIDVETIRLINKQYVDFNYSPESDYYQNTLFFQDSSSVNTFGLHEDIINDETIWYVTSAHALNLAQRKIAHLRLPPKRFNIDSTLVAIHRQLGETIRLVDSFYNQTSRDAWGIIEYDFDMNSDRVKYSADSALTLRGFLLDISTLDNQVEVLI